MRAKIFQWINDPTDKLRLVQTFPEVAELMGWNEATLYFQLTYPLLFPHLAHHRIPNPDDFSTKYDWKSIVSLCQVSKTLKEIVLAHFEKDIVTRTYNDGDKYYGLHFDDNCVHTLDEFDEFLAVNRYPWMRNLPYLFRVNVAVFHWSVVRQWQEILEFLENRGRKLWAMSIYFSFYGRIEDFRNRNYIEVLMAEEIARNPNLSDSLILNDILERTPNLQFLQFDLDLNKSWIPNQPLNDITRFPDLPDLKSLEAACHPVINLAMQYGSQLKRFYNLKEHPVTLPEMNQVESCGLVWPEITHENFQNPLRKILEFSPIKSLNLHWLPDINLISTGTLFVMLSSFGGSLEKLTVDSPYVRNAAGMVEYKTRSLDIRLPKLKYFRLSFYSGGNYEFLLALPALKLLRLDYCKPMQDKDGVRRTSPDWLSIPFTFEKRLDTKFWDNLPTIKSIEVDDASEPSGDEIPTFSSTRFKVTRERRQGKNSFQTIVFEPDHLNEDFWAV